MSSDAFNTTSPKGFSNNNLQARLHQLRSNKAFELFVVGIIIFSALVIGAKTYEIPTAVNNLIIGMDWFITLFFLTEITIRFLGEPHKRDFFKSGWNIFDTLIVVISLIPIEDSELALVGRLVRIFRVLRMVSIIPELRTLLTSLLKALPQLGYVALMMFIIFYIYAAIGSMFFASVNEFYWGDIAISMLTLFRIMTFESWTAIMYETMEAYPFSWVYYVSFIFLAAFAFLNMIIGIVVNVMNDEHSKERAQEALDAGEPTLKELQTEIRELKSMLAKHREG